MEHAVACGQALDLDIYEKLFSKGVKIPLFVNVCKIKLFKFQIFEIWKKYQKMKKHWGFKTALMIELIVDAILTD